MNPSIQHRTMLTATRWLVAALAAILTGCASLPDHVVRVPSQAQAVVTDGRLAAVATASMTGEDRALSGLRLLPDGEQAFEARIALVRSAEHAVDAQYYQVADDASGRQFLGELCSAAARGVRVRLLVDDLHNINQDASFAALAAQPGVQVRLFNPLATRNGGVAGRVLLSLHEFSRVNRRMHNKLLIADNALSISGGRNIADEYFSRGSSANFIDLDILAAGPVVREQSAVFDGYWNSQHAYPVESLATRTTGTAPPAEVAEAARAETGLDRLGQSAVGHELLAGRLTLHMAAVRVVADPADKADAANDAITEDGAVMRSNLELLQSARSEVLVASPYFVPGQRTLAVLQHAVDRQVPVSVMTNSLGSTDEPLVHFGYARYRTGLLAMGVSLFELMPEAVVSSEEAGRAHGSLGRLHAKVAVVDRRWLQIGSMNMDRRSAHCNTEMGLIVDSPVLAEQVTALMRGERMPGSYQVRRGSQPASLQWVAAGGAGEVVLNAEPKSTWQVQLKMSMLQWLVSEEWL